tara:strand:- start:318 stop:1229 length:912 start_codon:yes stop_codon:yes gene_type:complete
MTFEEVQHALYLYREKYNTYPLMSETEFLPEGVVWRDVYIAHVFTDEFLNRERESRLRSSGLALSPSHEITPSFIVSAMVAYQKAHGRYPTPADGDADLYLRCDPDPDWKMTWRYMETRCKDYGLDIVSYPEDTAYRSLATMVEDLTQYPYFTDEDLTYACEQYVRETGEYPVPSKEDAAPYLRIPPGVITWEVLFEDTLPYTDVKGYCIARGISPLFTQASLYRMLLQLCTDAGEIPDTLPSGDYSAYFGEKPGTISDWAVEDAFYDRRQDLIHDSLHEFFDAVRPRLESDLDKAFASMIEE